MTVTTTTSITTIRLAAPAHANPIERVISTVGRVDLALTDRIHDGDGIRPYSVARHAHGLDVIVFDDDLASALLRGDPDAKLVTRTKPESLMAGEMTDMLRLAFETPCHFRVAGYEYQIPDPFHVFGSLLDRWQGLDLPDLDPPDLKRVGVYPEHLVYRTMPCGGRAQRGFVGVVRYDLRGLDRQRDVPAERRTLWTLARFAEHRGVGKHTTYGLGRVRVLT